MFKRYRQLYSRKMSREATMYDILIRTICCSDPLILKNNVKPKKHTPLSPAVIALLREGSI